MTAQMLSSTFQPLRFPSNSLTAAQQLGGRARERPGGMKNCSETGILWQVYKIIGFDDDTKGLLRWNRIYFGEPESRKLCNGEKQRHEPDRS
jgi:hypothetical protein